MSTWHAATPSAPQLSPYRFDEHVEAAELEDAPPSLVIGHAGHGGSSWVVSYCLVIGRVRLLLQLQHGGVYMNHDEAAGRICAVFGIIERNLVGLERRAARPRTERLYHSTSSGPVSAR